MANEEQLSILKQGVIVWNKWRGKISMLRSTSVKRSSRYADLSERQSSAESNLMNAQSQRRKSQDANLEELI